MRAALMGALCSIAVVVDAGGLFFTARQIADPDRFHNGGEADFLPEYPVDQRLHLIGGPARLQLHKQSQNIPAVQVVDHDLVLARRAVDPAEQFVDLARKNVHAAH